MSIIPDQAIVWGAYARLSRKKTSKRRRGRYGNPDASVQRQLRLIRAYAAEHGLTLDEDLIFTDNGRSGWQKPGGPPPYRPRWDAMIAAGKAGKFGGLLVWKLDRFARNVRDGQDLADLAVLLDGPETGRMDLRTNHDLSIFNDRIEAARNYSHETSEKVRGAFAEMLESGYRVGGSGRLFGFEILSQAEFEGCDDDEDEDREGLTGPAAVIREDEAEIIRELARRLLRGDTVEAMADWLNGQDRPGCPGLDPPVTTTREGRWNARNLCRTLGNPLYGGRLEYKGEPITNPAGEPVTLAEVEPIMPTEMFERVQAKLGKRKRGRRVSGRFPLSGELRCGNPACARRGTMAGVTRTGGKRAYICARANGGCGQSILAIPTEAKVRDDVVNRLADVEALEAARAADATLDAERAKLGDVLRDLDDDMADTEAKRAQTPRSATRLRAQHDQNLASMAARYEAAERELEGLGPVAGEAPPLPSMTAENWDSETTTAARKVAIIRRLHLCIEIRPPARRQGASRLPFETERVQITRLP